MAATKSLTIDIEPRISDEGRALLDELKDVRQPSPRIEVNEPDIYNEHSRASFFADMARVKRDKDPESTERLARHQQYETRTNPNSTAGTGGEFTVPAWVISKFQTVARTGRVMGDLVTNIVLPRGVSSINIPKMTTGADATIQTSNAQPAQDVDQVTSNAGSSTNVVTIAGEADVSQQLFDLTPSPPGYDGIVYTDLSLAYNQALELQMLAGSGANGQLTGITKVAGIGSVSGSGVSTTQNTSIQTLWTLMGQAAAIIGTQRQLPAEYIIMAPRRYYSIASALDSQNRPLGAIGGMPHLDDLPLAGGGRAVDRLIGIPTYLSGGIIQAASSAADYILVARVTDMLLFESTPKFTVNVNPVAGTLQVKLSLHRYVAFLNFKPSSIAVVTSIPQPTNF